MILRLAVAALLALFHLPAMAATAVEAVRVPDGGLQPQVAVDRAGGVHLVYFKGDPAGGDIYYVHRTAGRPEWSPALRVNSQPGSAIASGTIRGAHLALGRNGRVHVSWNGSRLAEPKGSQGMTPMLYARLNDSGTAFEPQRNLMQLTGVLDGGGAVAADRAGNVYVIWHATGAVRGEENRQVFVAASRNDGQTFAREKSAWSKPTGACGCCGLNAFAGDDGVVYVLYRAATNSTERDMYVLASRDSGKTFRGLRVHPWHLNACPMSSAAIAPAGSEALLAWQTEQQVYYARLNPRAGRAPKPIPAPGTGSRKFPVVATDGRGQTILVWAEGTGWQKGGSIAWQVFNQSGEPSGEHGEAPGLATWSLPAVYARPGGGFTVLY